MPRADFQIYTHTSQPPLCWCMQIITESMEAPGADATKAAAAPGLALAGIAATAATMQPHEAAGGGGAGASPTRAAGQRSRDDVMPVRRIGVDAAV